MTWREGCVERHHATTSDSTEYCTRYYPFPAKPGGGQPTQKGPNGGSQRSSTSALQSRADSLSNRYDVVPGPIRWPSISS